MSNSTGTAQGTSLQQFLTPLVLNFIIFAVLIAIFIILREKLPRTYQPKKTLDAVPPRRRAHALPSGLFSWFMSVVKEDDAALLGSAGLDAYLFVRYLKFMLMITVGGCLSLWPILLPIYATGPGGQSGLDVISISNIAGSAGRYYGAVLMGWIFIAFVCCGILHEYRRFVHVRAMYLTTSQHSSTLQARSVLIPQIPAEHMTEGAIRDIFDVYPGGIKEIYWNRDLQELEDNIELRDKLIYKLEAAEVKLIRTANKNNFKSLEKTAKDEQIELTDSEHAREGAAKYVPSKKRPSHKLGFLGLVGQKVDTIDYCRAELVRLCDEINAMQADPESFKKMNSCFIEFHTQIAAQMCCQVVASRFVDALHPRVTEVSPRDIVSSNLALSPMTRMIKSTLAFGFVTALIILWSIPVAFVGLLSNITYLTEKVHFLRFILDCPKFLLGLITAYLPTIMLAVLMALLPIILRYCAKFSGVPTHSSIEYTVSNTYFTFLVVQSFLVVTVVGSATAAIPKIAKQPGSVTTILASKLPTSSNFYIAYILLQGLAVASGTLAQIVPLIMNLVLGKVLDGTPRKKWARYNHQPVLKFGTLFPIFSFLAMISLTFSLIAPFILLFSAFAFAAFYIAFKYNFLFVYSLNTSTTGLLYPRALQQTMVGIYFLEICMIGLVSVGKSFGAIVLMVIALVATIFFHLRLNASFSYLLDVVPIDAAKLGSSSEKQFGLAASHSYSPSMTHKNRESDEHASGDIHQAMDTQQWSTYKQVALTSKCPTLWLPTDFLGVSDDEVVRIKTVTALIVQSGGSFVDKKGALTWDGQTPPADFCLQDHDFEL